MEKATKMVDQTMQDEMVGILTAISIVAKRLACRLSNLDTCDEAKMSNASKEGEVV